MLCKGLSVLVLIVIASASEMQSTIGNNANEKYINSEYLSKKILPNVQNLLNEQNVQDGDKMKFLNLVNDLEVEGYTKVDDTPFTIVIPKLTFNITNLDKNTLTELVLEHLIPGIQMKSLRSDDSFGNLNHNEIRIKNLSPTQWTLNDVKVLKFNGMPSKLISFIEIDGFLNDRKNNFAKRNIQENNRYNEPQKLEMKDVNKSDTPAKEGKVNHLMNYLASMKSGTKVFQHFLAKSNLSQILEESSFTILIPSDNAFQRWHPIDWGFYPFSVQEFTENVLRNHVLQMKQPLKMIDVKHMDNEQRFKTLGGEYVTFKNHPTPNVNNVSIISDHTLPNGNEIFIISEVLFVSEAVVSRLHQMNKDKETPPLLAFPWFGAQFLSHAFLALERDNRFTQVTRFLNIAEIAPYISGSNYTFFVPFDEAFEKYSFDVLSDEVLGSEKGIKLILNHFVKGRLYDRNLKNDEVFETVGGKPIKISRIIPGQVSVNRANIVESEIFVYNLGTMFYVDDILYPEVLQGEVKPLTESPNNNKKRENESSEDNSDFYTTETSVFSESAEKISTKSTKESTTSSYRTQISSLLTTRSDVEFVPSRFTELSGSEEDFLLQDGVVTPKALPLRFNLTPPKK
ncbi:unnamed protein product [Diamesa hyperborea]